ncbi:MAG: D-2-hydroxyacid dehydrogenase [Sedimentisphaerales bacterium]
MMNIVFLDKATITLNDIDFTGIQSLGAYCEYHNSTESQVLERATDADVIIANKAPITKLVIEMLKKLKLVSIVATGYNNVDIAAARLKGVTVCNVAGYAGSTVPQHTFALILNLVTNAYKYYSDIQNGKWHNAASFTLLSYPTSELAGKTIGIIGFGAIGRQVAKIAEAFDMRVLVFDVCEIKDGKYKSEDLDTLLTNSDIVTLHCPLTEQTKNLIDASALSKMKRTALLINTARGGIVDEHALAGALNSGKLAGAGVDVLTQEPPKNGNILFTAKNVILTPHSAWSTIEARQRLIDETVRNIKAFFEGNPRNVVS